MRVTLPTIFNSINSNLQNLAGDLRKVNASISSGKKYQDISDNPLDVGAILGLNQQENQTSQYERNLETATGWLNVTESTMQNITNIVQVSAALANQMATGTYNAAQRQAAAQQVQGYMEEVMQEGNSQYNGQYVMGGYRTDTPPFGLGDWQVQPPVMHLTSGSSGTAVSGGTYTRTSSCTYVVQIASGGGTGIGTYKVSADGGQTWTDPPSFPPGRWTWGMGRR